MNNRSLVYLLVMLITYLFICLVIFSVVAFADSSKQQRLQEGKAFAKEQNKKRVNGLSVFNCNDNSEDTPCYTGWYDLSNDSLPKYNSSSLDTMDANARHRADNPSKNDFDTKKAITTRPQFFLDTSSDPLFIQEKSINKKAHLLTKTYEDCIEFPDLANRDATVDTSTPQSCTVSASRTLQKFMCERKLVSNSCVYTGGTLHDPFTINDTNVTTNTKPRYFSIRNSLFSYAYTSKDIDLAIDSWSTHEKIIFSFSLKPRKRPMVPYGCRRAGKSGNEETRCKGKRPHKNINISLKKTLSFSANVDTLKTLQLEKISGNVKVSFNDNQLTSTTNTDLLPNIQQNNTITVSARVEVFTGADFSVSFIIRRVSSCSDKKTYAPYACFDSAGKAVNIAPPVSKEISTIDTTADKDTTKKRFFFTRLADPVYTKDAACTVLENKGCSPINVQCLNKDDTFCAQQKLTYSCPSQPDTSIDASPLVMCGNTLFCPDGNCVDKDYTSDHKAFMKAATAAAVVNQINNEIDFSSDLIFTGEVLSCKREVSGISNCCNDTSWINLPNACNATEKKLMSAIRNKQTVSLGSKCTKKYPIIGTCQRRKYKHCVYKTKLSLLIIRGAKRQLKRDFGNYGAPDCSGLTIEELDQIDFDKISELEQYFQSTLKQIPGTTPDNNDLITTVQERLQKKYKNRFSTN